MRYSSEHDDCNHAHRNDGTKNILLMLVYLMCLRSPVFSYSAEKNPMGTPARIRWCFRRLPPGLSQERRPPLPGGQQVAHDGARRQPTPQVVRRTGLVVGAAGASSTEGLLPHHCAGGPIVDVEVARRVPQHAQRLVNHP